MKKFLLFSVFIFTGFAARSQTDTLVWNDFETDPASYMQIAIPPGQSTDTSWYTFDIDGLADGSPSNRPGEWFWSSPFSDNDTIGNTAVLASNSWSNSPTPTDNILVTPSIYIGDATAVLSWKSAPFQTPRYLDGYQVIIASGNNDLNAFTDTLFVAAEYASLDNASFPNSFSSYTFLPGPTANPMDPFVHGIDGTYTDPNTTDPNDSSRLLGRLRPFSVSLAAYNGQTIYIMFHHGTTDDNLISVDDILVTGTDFTAVAEQEQGVIFSAYPNPSSENVTISYNLPASSAVTVNVYDITGKLMSVENKGNLSGSQQHTIDVSAFSAGIYRVELVTAFGRSNQRIVVQ
jgi:hypothetical protein